MPPVLERVKLVCTNILPMSLVVFMVIGFIILGWTTPTEAAAFGVLGVMILAVGVLYGHLLGAQRALAAAAAARSARRLLF